MKKLFGLLLLGVIVFGVAGCVKIKNSGDLVVLSEATVKERIKGWKIYTNPAYRYELRFPQNWSYKDTGEDGVGASFFPLDKAKDAAKSKEKYFGDIVIISHSNWKESYNLEDFYRHQTENLFLGGYDKEEITLSGEKAIWFKAVRGKNPELSEKTVDLIALDLKDRIIEIEIHEKDDWDIVKTIINSIKFYSNKVISELDQNGLEQKKESL